MFVGRINKTEIKYSMYFDEIYFRKYRYGFVDRYALR